MRLLYLVLLATLFTFSSCQKCYECEKYEFCLDCVGSGGNGPVYYENCYTTPSERDVALQQIQSGQGGSSINCEMLENKIEGMEEACGNKKTVEADIEFWEEEGYKCTME